MFTNQEIMSKQQTRENSSTNVEDSPSKGVKRPRTDNSSNNTTTLAKLLTQKITDAETIQDAVAKLQFQYGVACDFAMNAQKDQQLLSNPPDELQALESYDRQGKLKKVSLLNGFPIGSRVTKFLLRFHHIHPDPLAGDAQMVRDALLAQLTNAILFPSN